MSSEVSRDGAEVPKVLYPYTGDRLGGSYFSSKLVAQYLESGGLARVTVAYPEGTEIQDLFERSGIALHPYKIPHGDLRRIQDQGGVVRKILSVPAQARMIRLAGQVIREVRPDIVHVNDDRSLFPWAIAARQAGLPVVWHVRQRRMNAGLDPLRVSLSDRCILIAEDTRKRFPYSYGGERRVVVHNAVDPHEFSPLSSTEQAALRANWGFPSDRPVIAFISNVVPRKRPEWFLDLLKDLAKAGRNVFGVFAGSAKDAEYFDGLRDQARALVENGRLVFLGPIRDVSGCLNASDILVLPTKAEPFGRILVEAMACGTVAVAARGGGALEIIEDRKSGILFDPDSQDDLTRRVCELLDDPVLRTTLAEGGIMRAREGFSPDAAAGKVAEVYRSLLAKGAGR